MRLKANTIRCGASLWRGTDPGWRRSVKRAAHKRDRGMARVMIQSALVLEGMEPEVEPEMEPEVTIPPIPMPPPDGNDCGGVIRGKFVWAFRTGIYYEGSTLHSIHETLGGACAAAKEFMDKENDDDRHFGTPQEWDISESEDGYVWSNETLWVSVKVYEIK